jgi:hypothetical protein
MGIFQRYQNTVKAGLDAKWAWQCFSVSQQLPGFDTRCNGRHDRSPETGVSRWCTMAVKNG